MTDQNNFNMPPEMWDRILIELAKKDIKTISECRKLSSFFNQLIKNNRSLRYFAVYPKVLTLPEDTEFQNKLNYFYRACVRGELGVAKILKESFEIIANKIKDEEYLEFRLIRDLCERNNLVSSNVPSFDRLNVLKWLMDEFNLSIRDKTQFRTNGNIYLMAACEDGELEIAEWLVDKFKMTEKDLVDSKYRSGEINGIHEDNVFQSACYGGYLEVVEWLYNKFKLTPEFVKSDNNHAFYRAYTGRYGESKEMILKRQKLIEWMGLKFNLKYSDIASMVNKKRCHVVHILW